MPRMTAQEAIDRWQASIQRAVRYGIRCRRCLQRSPTMAWLYERRTGKFLCPMCLAALGWADITDA